MNKIILVVLILLSQNLFSQNIDFEINGNVDKRIKGKVYLLSMVKNNYKTVLEDTINNGKFLLKGSLDRNYCYFIKLNNSKEKIIFLDTNKISIKTGERQFIFEGGKLNSEVKEWNKVRLEYCSSENKIPYFNFFDKYILSHRKSLYSLYLCNHQKTYFTSSQINILLKSLKCDFKNHPYYKQIKKYKLNLEKIDIGKKAPELIGENPNGRKISIKDFKGKYVLLDFWASWCGPCKANMPHLKNIHKKYKDKGLEIISISLDNKKKSWVECINKLNLPWHHVCDFKSSDADNYMIISIPKIILIDKNGRILSKPLPIHEVDKKLSNIFN